MAQSKFKRITTNILNKLSIAFKVVLFIVILPITLPITLIILMGNAIYDAASRFISPTLTQITKQQNAIDILLNSGLEQVITLLNTDEMLSKTTFMKRFSANLDYLKEIKTELPKTKSLHEFNQLSAEAERYQEELLEQILSLHLVLNKAKPEIQNKFDKESKTFQSNIPTLFANLSPSIQRGLQLKKATQQIKRPIRTDEVIPSSLAVQENNKTPVYFLKHLEFLQKRVKADFQHTNKAVLLKSDVQEASKQAKESIQALERASNGQDLIAAKNQFKLTVDAVENLESAILLSDVTPAKPRRNKK